MSEYSKHVPDNEIIKILNEYDLPLVILDDDELINTYEPINDDEISILMNVLYQEADNRSPTGIRTPADIERLINIQQTLEKNLNERKQQDINDLEYRYSQQKIAERERAKTELSVKKDIREKMMRLHQALQDPRIKSLFYKPELTHQNNGNEKKTFADINANPDSQNLMLSLTSKNKRNFGGKSRVFRRKNKITTSTSKRNVRSTQRTRRHRKSSTRRSRRK